MIRPRQPSYPTTIEALVDRAEKYGNSYGKTLYYCEVEDNFLKIFWTSFQNKPKVTETKDAVLIREVKGSDTKKFDSYGGKLDLCDFLLDFYEKKSHYNKKYYEMYGVPLYDMEGKLHPFYQKKHGTNYKIK